MSALNLMNALRIVFIVILIIGAAGTILFWFLFDMKNILSIRTGRAQKKTIEAMRQKNMETGRLIDYSFEVNTTAKTETGGKARTTFLNHTEEKPANETTTLQVTQQSQAEKQPVIMQAPAVKNNPDFRIIENVMIIHTNEEIQ